MPVTETDPGSGPAPGSDLDARPDNGPDSGPDSGLDRGLDSVLDGDEDAYAVVAYREGGRWQVEPLPDALTDDLPGLIDAVRAQPGEAGALALVDVADEFFVAVRVHQGRVRLLLSDVTASAEWDLAEQVLEHLDLDVPEDDELDEVWPAGDLDIFGDLGLDAMELGIILADLDAYADEMLSSVTRRLGFVEPYERVVDALSGR